MARLITTVVVILVVVGFALAVTGVLHFRNTTDETGVTLDKKELQEKTQKAVEKTGEVGGKILDKTGETLHEAAEQMRGSSDDQNSTTETPAVEDKDVREPANNGTPPENEEHGSNR